MCNEICCGNITIHERIFTDFQILTNFYRYVTVHYLVKLQLMVYCHTIQRATSTIPKVNLRTSGISNYVTTCPASVISVHPKCSVTQISFIEQTGLSSITCLVVYKHSDSARRAILVQPYSMILLVQQTDLTILQMVANLFASDIEKNMIDFFPSNSEV